MKAGMTAEIRLEEIAVRLTKEPINNIIEICRVRIKRTVLRVVAGDQAWNLNASSPRYFYCLTPPLESLFPQKRSEKGDTED